MRFSVSENQVIFLYIKVKPVLNFINNRLILFITFEKDKLANFNFITSIWIISLFVKSLKISFFIFTLKLLLSQWIVDSYNEITNSSRFTLVFSIDILRSMHDEPSNELWKTNNRLNRGTISQLLYTSTVRFLLRTKSM